MIRRLLGLLTPTDDRRVGTPTALCALVGVAAGTYLLAQYARQRQEDLMLATGRLYRMRREHEAIAAELADLEQLAEDQGDAYPAPEDVNPLGAGEGPEPRFMADRP